MDLVPYLLKLLFVMLVKHNILPPFLFLYFYIVITTVLSPSSIRMIDLF